MLKLEVCIFCMKPVIVNDESMKVFNIACDHDDIPIEHYVWGNPPAELVDHAGEEVMPAPTTATAANWIVPDGTEELQGEPEHPTPNHTGWFVTEENNE